MQKLKETGDSRYIYQNKLGKASFQHDMAFGDFKDLPRRRAADKVLSNKAFNATRNLGHDGYQCTLASIVSKCFDKKSSGNGVKSEIMKNQELAEELHKPIIRKFEKQKVDSSFKDNLWGANLSDIQLLSKFNKEFPFSLCLIDIYSKYSWIVSLKDKKGITVTNAFHSCKIII